MRLFYGKICVCYFFFFFQAEDGIRDTSVTGVQTCALPICPAPPRRAPEGVRGGAGRQGRQRGRQAHLRRRGEFPEGGDHRSEERRVGKECRSRWGREKYK